MAGFVDTLISTISTVPAAMLGAAESQYTAFTTWSGSTPPLAQTWLTLVFLAEVVIMLYGYWMKGGVAELIGRIIRTGVVTSLCLAALTNWNVAGTLISRTFQSDVASKFVTNQDPIAAIGAIVSVIQKFSTNIENGIRTGSTSTDEKTPYTPVLNQADIAESQVGASDAQGLFTLMFGLKYSIFMIVFIILVGVPSMFLCAAMLAALVGTKLIMAVGVSFGALAIAFAPWQYTSYLAINWIKFMATVGLTYAVAFALGSIVKAGVLIIANPLNGVPVDWSTLFGVVVPACMALGIMICFMAYMMTKADDIAQGMMSGNGAGGTAGFGMTAAGGVLASISKATRAANKLNRDRKQDNARKDQKDSSKQMKADIATLKGSNSAAASASDNARNVSI